MKKVLSVLLKKESWIFLTWFILLSIPIFYFNAFHYLPFNKKDLNISRIISSLPQTPHKNMQLHHFLGTGCGCSKKILTYLVNRKADDRYNEVVHLINNKEGWKEKLEDNGYQTEILTEESAVELYKIESIPQLVVTKEDRLLYQGGYNEQQSHRSDYKDLEMALALNKNESVKSYPLFGCANGKIAKKIQDPIGVKYE